MVSTAPLQARHIPTGLRRAACAVGLVSLMCSFCRWFVKSGDASSCLLAARSDRPRLSQARPAHRGYITTAAQCGLLGRHASLSLSSRLLTPRSELAVDDREDDVDDACCHLFLVARCARFDAGRGCACYERLHALTLMDHLCAAAVVRSGSSIFSSAAC